MATLSRLDSRDQDFDAKLSALLAFDAEQDEAIDSAAARILKLVRTEGDAALVYKSSRLPSSKFRAASGSKH